MTKVLGKGLGALIRNYNASIESEEFNAKLSIEKIVPNKNQPRKYFDSKELNSLINSIKEKGIIQPLTVRKVGNNNFEIYFVTAKNKEVVSSNAKGDPIKFKLKINLESNYLLFKTLKQAVLTILV